MQIRGPERYELNINKERYSVLCAKGTNRFSGLAVQKSQKIYVVTAGGKIIYVGITVQPITNRFRNGWKAAGETGYYGYKWRHEIQKANLDIWLLDSEDALLARMDIETIEAEIVFLIRADGQWPQYQTEIHFHPSNDTHRKLAREIYNHYCS